MKTIAHYNLDLEVIKELNRLFPSGQRSTFVNKLLKAYFEEIKKSPEESPFSSGFAENSKFSLVNGETKEVI